MVSIVVSMILILVLSLIVLSFARLTQREQRQILDRQLNAEAYYAAESGVNDGTRALLEGGPERNEETDDCDPPTGYDGKVDVGVTGTNIMYSCLLIDPTPTSLEYNNIGRGEAKIFPVDLRDGPSNTDRVRIFWQAPGSTLIRSGCPGAAANSFSSTWSNSCSSGPLRIDIVPVRKAGAFLRSDLINGVATIFAIPANSSTAGSIDINQARGFGNQGAIRAAGCSATTPTHPKHCEIEITNLNLRGNNGGDRYYIRLVPLYYSAEVTVCAPACGSPAQELKDAQAQVDSTGRASDVLRRIQVRVNTSDVRGQFPLAAIEANAGICKRISIAPPNAFDECGPI